MKHVFDRQVKLEEATGARENPAINEIQSDEGQWTRGDEESNSYWSEESNLLTKKHLRLFFWNKNVKKSQTQFHIHLSCAEENPVSFTPWRSHLGAPQIHQGESACFMFYLWVHSTTRRFLFSLPLNKSSFYIISSVVSGLIPLSVFSGHFNKNQIITRPETHVKP